MFVVYFYFHAKNLLVHFKLYLVIVKFIIKTFYSVYLFYEFCFDVDV